MFYSSKKCLWIERVETSDGRTKEISSKTQNGLARKLTAFRADAKNGPKFSDVADEWYEKHAMKVEPTTAQSYKPHMERAKTFFADEYIKDITPDEAQGFIDYLVERDFAKDTVRRGKVVLNKIFKYAITRPDSAIRFNPCDAVDVPRGLKQTKREPPTAEQIKKVSFDPQTDGGLFALFLLCTGLRPGELLALKWKDIDRVNKIITVHEAAQYASNKARIKDTTKTSAGMRTVPLLDVLNNALPEDGEGFVFGGSQPWTHSETRRIWAEWCAENGMAERVTTVYQKKDGSDYKKYVWKPFVTPYQFRHEYASMLEDENISEFSAQHVMGHASIITTKDKYTHFRQRKGQENEVADKLNARFAKVE